MDRDPDNLSLILPSAATRSGRPYHPRSEFDADGIRHAVRPMAARPRHPATTAGSEGKRQQADDSPDAKGQSRQGRDEDQTRPGVFGAYWATSHGIGTLLDRKPMTARVKLCRLNTNITAPHLCRRPILTSTRTRRPAPAAIRRRATLLPNAKAAVGGGANAPLRPRTGEGAPV
jgi:hypothetical protein